MSRREFQFVEGNSKKFWAIDLSGSSFTVHWGRIGTAGQTQTKDFASDAEAKKQYDKLIAEKLKKGYAEVSAGAGAGSGVSASAAVPAPAGTAAAQAPVATTAGSKTAPAKAGAKKKSTAANTNSDDGGDATETSGDGRATSRDTADPAPAGSAAPVTSARGPLAVNLKVARHIELSPGDWAWASWRPHQPLSRPAPQPFDLPQCAARVATMTTGNYGWDWKWADAGIPVAMTPEEAHFWMCALTKYKHQIKPADLAKTLLHMQHPTLSGDEAVQMLKENQVRICPETILPLSNVMPVDELIEHLIVPPQIVTGPRSYPDCEWNHSTEILRGFREYVLPYLSEAELAQARKLVAVCIDPKDWPTDHYHRPPSAFFLAAMIGGLSDQLLTVVRTWKDDSYVASGWDHTHYHQPQYIVLGLGSPQIVEAEMRRLKLPLNQPEYIRGWLATTQYAALDYVRDCILSIGSREEAEKLIRVFALVRAPEAAAPMLELKIASKAPKPAREWLDANVDCAIVGLLPATVGRGRLADAALDHLRELKNAGYGDAIRQAAGSEPLERLRAEVLDRVEKTFVSFDAASTPAWLKDTVSGAPRAKLPGWLAPHNLPVLVVEDHRLADDHVLAVLGALQKSPLDAPHALLAAIRDNVSAESRGAFAWRLFETWLAEGAPSKDKWAMGAIGHLGDDACVLKITPMIRNWPGESQHQRAVYGLECLRAIGTDTALMALNGIAQKLKFKGLKGKAMEYMEAIAAQRKMTRAELEDRIVPDCGLDERGTRIFDFGPRQFRFVLGPDMKPMIKYDDGKVKSDLPAAGARDDAARAAEAIEAWKLLKKTIREVARIQAERLEQAMVTGRRWKATEFEALLVRHPLMINFVRLLVWGGFNEQGALKMTFRVTEDQTYADQRDEEIEFAGIAQVGIVHPLHLSDDARRAWGEVLSDYEIVPPFEQVGRPIYALQGDEAQAKEIKRFDAVKIPATALVGTLERLSWQRGVPQDGGVFYEHSKPFYGANLTAVVQYSDGVPVGYMEGWDDQTITECFFVPGIYTPEMYPEHTQAIPLGKVDPVAVSEVLRDLTLIAAKGK